MGDLPDAPIVREEFLLGRAFKIEAVLSKAVDVMPYIDLHVRHGGEVVLSRRHYLAVEELAHD